MERSAVQVADFHRSTLEVMQRLIFLFRRGWAPPEGRGSEWHFRRRFRAVARPADLCPRRIDLGEVEGEVEDRAITSTDLALTARYRGGQPSVGPILGRMCRKFIHQKLRMYSPGTPPKMAKRITG